MRICPDCESRELERYRHFCSECAQIRRSITNDICRHNYRSNPVTREIHNSYMREYMKAKFVSRKQWKELACRPN